MNAGMVGGPWIPYVIVLPLAIIRLNRRQAALRREEAC
jgi:hypothetical protein